MEILSDKNYKIFLLDKKDKKVKNEFSGRKFIYHLKVLNNEGKHFILENDTTDKLKHILKKLIRYFIL